MKTKLFAVMMMGLAVFGIIGNATYANTRTSTDNFANAGFWALDYAGGVWVTWAGEDQGDSLISVIKNAINWVLWLLAIIALVLLLWWGFQMVTAAGDDNKYKAGFKILKTTWIGLAFIACSWLMVSLIFWVIWGSGASTESEAAHQTVSAAGAKGSSNNGGNP